MKKTFFAILVLVIGYLSVELFSFSILSLQERQWLAPSELTSLRRANAGKGTSISLESHDPTVAIERHALHPYLGYVRARRTSADKYGFANELPPIQKRAKDKVIIAVTGGSFARGTYHLAGQSLVDGLKEDPEYADREIVVLSLAGPGYKQPQQLMALNYLLSLGAEFDIVINLDGFNEVALSVGENISAGVFPFYPRMWHLRVGRFTQPSRVRALSRFYDYRRWRKRLLSFFEMDVLRSSYAGYIIWASLDKIIVQRENRIQRFIEAWRPSGYEARGPKRTYGSDEDMFHDLASVWKRSSLLMKALCDANNIQYFHFLQPNQYVPGSKALSPEEEKNAYDPKSRNREGVEGGYPYLQSEGAELLKAGVAFKDLSMIYSDDHRTLYTDTCCHVNKEGYEVIAQAIVNEILQGRPVVSAAA